VTPAFSLSLLFCPFCRSVPDWR